MATVGQAGYNKKRSDNNPRFDGIKCNNGEFVHAGQVIVKQRSTHYREGDGTYLGDTGNIHAAVDGYVYFQHKARVNFAGKKHDRTYVFVRPESAKNVSK